MVALNEVNFVWTETVQLQVDTSQTAVAAEPKSLTFVADSGEDWTVFPGVLKTFEVVLELDDNFERTVQLVLGSADDVPKYDACCAYVTFRRREHPVHQLPSVAGHDVLTFDMGRLCSVPIAPRNTTTHQLRVTLGVRPHSALTAGDQLGVTVTVLLDGTVMAAGAVFGQTPAPPTTTAAATTVGDAPLAEGDMALSEGDGEISLVNSSDSTPMTNMSGTTWARFNVSVPTSSVAKLSLVVTGYSEHGRAAVVPTGGLRFLGRGRNVPCAALSDLNDTIELSSTLSNSQNDVLSLDAGYVRYGSLESTITQGVALQRLGTELPDMELVAWADNDLPYLPNAQVPVDIIVRNRPNATADAINATVTLALPPYMAFGSVAWTNFSEPPAVAVRRHAVLLSWPRLLPGEGLHVQLLLTVDPTNKRGHGAGYAAACHTHLPARYHVPQVGGALWSTGESMLRGYGIPTLESGVYPPQGKLWYPMATPTYINFDVNSEGWSPEQRDTPFIHWHQVDFGNLTRVTGLLVARPAGTRRVTRFRLQHSLAGTVFQDIGPVMALNWSSLHSDGVVTHRLDRAVETRYVRFVIEEAETGDDKYIGLQVEYLGCRRSTDVLQETVCAVQPATPGRRACYVSHDSSSWRQLPNVIERMVGFDESSGKIYGAGRSPDTLLWSTDGGNTWAPEAKASGSAGFTGRTIGDWTASYHGLSQGGQLRVKWSALTCST
ncbi:Contactin-associated protein like 5-4 [Amphibalanus amphitrite]|uniref:Contactin-associated protein like 5-4 n=1 Tax=Amphibalanus amphitrite TaxID=1232801 RepID=A0A6A4WJ41_AMPAM|nr:Contactin-associated protein like 5-4 [Amphibalanus amphitrite]